MTHLFDHNLFIFFLYKSRIVNSFLLFSYCPNKNYSTYIKLYWLFTQYFPGFLTNVVSYMDRARYCRFNFNVRDIKLKHLIEGRGWPSFSEREILLKKLFAEN